MPSIAFLSFGIGRSGGEKVIVKLANGLQKKGWDASIVAPRNAIKDFYPITAKVIATEPFRQVPFLEIPWSKQVLTRNCPKVDIVVGTWCLTIPSAQAAVRQDKARRMVYLAQHYEPIMFRGIKLPYRGLVDRYYRTLGPTTSVSSWIRDQIVRVGGPDCTIIHPGIDHKDFYPRKVTKKPTQICAFGSTLQWKGTMDLIAAAQLARKQTPLRLVLIGRDVPPIPPELGNSVAPDNNHLAEILSESAFHVMPSWLEGFSAPPLEAAACGIPSIITDCGGPSDYARHEENCLLVRPHDPEGMTAAIVRLLRDDTLRDQLGKAALKTAEAFTWERMVT
ncbi:hypothetical protein COV94_06945, partial [Candidatus Woesearchaeota archaeon CG11_big_fil_rev_8_21_14_0_20_57_5]